MVRRGWLLLLAGCPFLFEEPDLSKVDQADDDDDTNEDGDADTDADADSDSDTDIDPALLPEVVTFEVSPRSNGLQMRFYVEDEQDDFVGGSLVVSDGSSTWSLPVPGGIDDWNDPATSEHLLLLDKTWLFPDLDSGPDVYEPDCSAGVDLTWSLTAIDAAGHESEPKDVQLAVTGAGTIPEPDYPYIDAGSPPFVVCAVFEGLTELGRVNDLESFDFSTVVAGTYLFDLAWDGNADLDLYVYTLPGYQTVVAAQSSDVGTEIGRLVVPGADTWAVSVDYFGSTPGPAVPPYVGRLIVTEE